MFRAQRGSPTSLPGALALLLAALCCAAPVRAQDPPECPAPPLPGPLSVTPASGANQVTIEAPVKVVYTPDFFSEVADPSDFIELRVLGEDALVPGRTQVFGDVLLFQPDSVYLGRTDYIGTAFGAGGAAIEFEFRTGLTRDTATPRFDGITNTSTMRVDPSCEALEGGYRVDVSFAPATDGDGPGGSLEYLLYQSRGANLEAPVLRKRARNFATDLVTMAFILPPEDAVESICLVVHVVDGVGRVHDTSEPRCFEPISGNFFEPACAVVPGTGSSGSAALWLAFVAAVLGRRRLSRRRLSRRHR